MADAGIAHVGIDPRNAGRVGLARHHANVALGFSKQSIEAAGGGPLAWIAATLSGLAVMTSTIAAIKSATKGGFAEGGIVPGNSFSGDMLRTSDYGINSGELILNKAQQNSIAGQLEEGGNRIASGQADVRVSADILRLTIRNGARKRGMTVADYLEL